MRLNGKALGLAVGILYAFCLFVTTLWVMFFGGGEHLVMIKRFYIGYSISVPGALLGAFYAFIDGFLGGWLLAFLYNRFDRS